MTLREHLENCLKYELIRIDGKETPDPDDPFAWHIWEGLPADVPNDFKEMEVLLDLWFEERFPVHVFEILDKNKMFFNNRNGVTR
jgi:hypothetical protein